MGKLLFIWALVSMFISCQRQQSSQSIDSRETETFNLDTLSQSVQANEKATAIINEWPEYKILNASVERVYKVENEEELILVIEEVIEDQKVLEQSEYPVSFDTPQIKSRQKVFKTYLLKVKAALQDRTELRVPVSEMIGAYNDMRSQFNVIVNNNLDSLLILDN